jgi:hypothetical protein
MAQIRNRWNGDLILDSSHADLRSADLRDADLCGANLRDADLRGADLRSADIRSANLSGANLREADLCGANLRGADLRDADLRSADLSGADLCGANLSGANLRSADLNGTNLRSADLRSADLNGTHLDPDATIPDTTDEDLIAAGFEISGEYVLGWRTACSQHCGDTMYVTRNEPYCAQYFSTDADTPCHPGIYLAGMVWLEREYAGVDLVRVKCRRDELVQAGDKWRAKRVWVISHANNH